ncbi:hypothetical protein CYMTET_52499 [Cymbomonas tetramitiformis]|uniref:RING-type E3 ubiquitin transferase n=1 Tax=Cymbomonas tetramitiformis TaxID=36881 RepID=A0AAE0BIX1_9CHLO|nr:hypothetical protein CYMTET_52499 [Cymbomonas tetramitiformis]
MGKKRHSKDRAYITKTEWATEWGGFKNKDVNAPFRQLPFFCCALTFVPFEDPVATDDGMVFEITHIIPYLQKFKTHPVTGNPLKISDLTKLNFTKNAESSFCCPVLGKVFTASTHIVAIKTSGNVYCYQAIEEMCIKAKFWRDLVTDEKFTRKDIITIQDPMNVAAREVTKFDHLVKDKSVDVAPEAPDSNINTSVSADTKAVLKALGTDTAKEAFERGGGGTKAESQRILAAAKQAKEAAAKPSTAAEVPNMPESIQTAEDKNRIVGLKFLPGSITWDTYDPEQHRHGGAHRLTKNAKWNKEKREAAERKQKAKEEANPTPAFTLAPTPTPVPQGIYLKTSDMRTTGAGSRAFTSTVCDPVTENTRAVVEIEKNPDKKGYVQLQTNFGNINLELHCDVTPRTCENFITLCEGGYYNGVKFHRSIKNFMLQGGDPKGDGTGGESIWRRPFKDEFNAKLLHSERGILSMANSGPNTNGSQFFITYKSAKHLDWKHTVFGKVVGGMEVLGLIEKIKTDDADRPKEEVRIEGTTTFVNPYADWVLSGGAQEEEEDEEDNQVGSWFTNPTTTTLTARHTGVGKYLPAAAPVSKSQVELLDSSTSQPAAKKAKVVPAGSFGNFSGW